MARVLTECPRVSSPCPQLPSFARGQKSVFCDLCQKRVHNLSAMTARERESLLAGGGPLCVRYAYLLPAAALLLASQSALAQDSEEDDVAQMERVEVTGGGIGGVNDLVFLESEEGDDAWMDETRRTESE
ncbi:MAG TPA: hypothetical protein VN259_14650 [Xanthomonadales bacterium]|nr:hypothetical protein [Xanthomonadales bacterium]